MFPAASGLDDKLVGRYGLAQVALCGGLVEQFFAIATEKRVLHPLVQRLLPDPAGRPAGALSHADQAG